MLRYHLSIGLLLLCSTAFTQNKAAVDNLSQVAETIPDPKIGIYTIDSPSQALQTKLDSIYHLNLPTEKNDSLQQAWQSQLDKLSNPLPLTHKLDSLLANYQSKIDSLQSLNLPHEKYLTKLDSITQLPEQKLLEKWLSCKEKQKQNWNPYETLPPQGPLQVTLSLS